MKTLVVKELREQFRVGLIGFAVLTVMLILAFQGSRTQMHEAALSQGFDGGGFQPLLSKPLLIQITFICGIFGALLGFMQIHSENHPDLWAFLVHRPIPRPTILRSKLVSGLLLYGLGVGLPLLGFVVMVSIPGKIGAPFKWAMALPLLAIFLCGTSFYFAGLLVGLRKARWFGSRGFALGPAIAASFLLFAVAEFWQALLVVGGMTLLLALAVRGSFLAGGWYRAQSAAGKVALTVTSLVSILILGGALFVLLVNLFIGNIGITYSHYQLLSDGRVVKITQQAGDEVADGVEILDLSGKPVVNLKTGQNLQQKDLRELYPAGITGYAVFDKGPRKKQFGRNGYADFARFFVAWRVVDKSIWYLKADGRLVAYDGISRRPTAVLAPPQNANNAGGTGFLLPATYSWNYPQDYIAPEIMGTDSVVYSVDLEKREVKPVFTVPNGETIGACVSAALPDLQNQKQNLVLVLTRTTIRLLSAQGQPLLSLPYQPSFPSYPTVSLHYLQSSNTFVVRLDPDYELNKAAGGKLLSHLEWVDAGGNVGQTVDLPELPEPRQDWGLRPAIALLPLGFPAYDWDQSDRIWNLLRIVPALFSVCFGWRLGRRHNLSFKARIGWGLFHLICGLPGLLAFLAVQEWPATEICPSCKKPRAVDQEHCEHCRAKFPAPEKTHTEIFEPLTAT